MKVNATNNSNVSDNNIRRDQRYHAIIQGTFDSLFVDIHLSKILKTEIIKLTNFVFRVFLGVQV